MTFEFVPVVPPRSRARLPRERSWRCRAAGSKAERNIHTCAILCNSLCKSVRIVLACLHMRMTEAMRNELVVAIEDGQIDNATAFARDFAAKHGLNPVTVRTTISRLRRERGLGTQHS